MIFDISKFNYFQNGNPFTGSKEQFNFKIVGKDDQFEVAIWYGWFCYDKSEILARKEFPFTAEGLDEVIAWLEVEYAVYQEKQL